VATAGKLRHGGRKRKSGGRHVDRRRDP